MMPAHAAENRAPVAIVGAGPVGLSMAVGLARRGVRSVLFERKEGTNEHSRAPAIHVRTREVFRQWGVERRFLDAGELRSELILHNTGSGRRRLLTIDLETLSPEADRPGLLVLEQGRTETLLLHAVRDSGLCDVRFGTEVTELTQGDDGVRLFFRRDGKAGSVEAEYVVGCDGAGSFVREALGLSFEGITYSIRPMLADVRVEDERDALPWPRVRNGSGGFTFTVRLSSGLWRIIRLDRRDPDKGDEVPDEELNALVHQVLGPGPTERVWANRFRIHRRSAPRFRKDRVLLAGDAAHLHSPAGALGMNAGIQDAHNLAWKLASALDGGDEDRLLDSYDEERRAVVVGTVSRYADFITRTMLQSPSVIRRGMFFLWDRILRIHPLRMRALRRMTMIDLHYPPSPLLADGARSAGVRLPNVLLRAPEGGAIRLYDLLPYGSALIAFGSIDLPADLPVDEVVRIDRGAHRDPGGSLTRLIGGKTGWILVRPDAHVARVGTDPAAIAPAITHALGRHR